MLGASNGCSPSLAWAPALVHPDRDTSLSGSLGADVLAYEIAVKSAAKQRGIRTRRKDVVDALNVSSLDFFEAHLKKKVVKHPSVSKPPYYDAYWDQFDKGGVEDLMEEEEESLGSLSGASDDEGLQEKEKEEVEIEEVTKKPAVQAQDACTQTIAPLPPSTGQQETPPPQGNPNNSSGPLKQPPNKKNQGSRFDFNKVSRDKRNFSGFTTAASLLPKKEGKELEEVELEKESEEEQDDPHMNAAKTILQNHQKAQKKTEKDGEKEEKNAHREAAEECIVQSQAQVKEEDIVGLKFAKQTVRTGPYKEEETPQMQEGTLGKARTTSLPISQIREILIIPQQLPHLFTSPLTRPPRGLLLFGPPGTGKTMLAKWIASECKATFFNVGASAIFSKWIGEGEKMVRAIFSLASEKAPSVVFIDEIDSVLCARSESDHESTRRLKNEFLTALEGRRGEVGRK